MPDIQFLIDDLADGDRVSVVLAEHVQLRLARGCFRGRRICRSGSSLWTSFGQMMHDPDMRELFRKEVRAALNHAGTVERFHESFMIRHPTMPVGWNGTAPRASYTEEQLEPYQPNHHCTGLLVRASAGLLAPLTHSFTFVTEFSHSPSAREWTVRLHSMYPGEDIGELDGDIVAREGRVFLGWDMPGEFLESR